MNGWADTLDGRGAVSAFLLTHASLDPATIQSAHDFWMNASPATLRAERDAAWQCNDPERFMIARSLLGPPLPV